MAATVTAIRRLQAELVALRKSQNPQITVRPSSNVLQWHFVLHSLPSDTPYSRGCYHGKILFPQDFPRQAPSILMVTPSGKLRVGVRLCLGVSETWNPAWSVETVLLGLFSHFTSDKETGHGLLKASLEVRQQLASMSWEANAKDQEFAELFPEFLQSSSSANACLVSDHDQIATEQRPGSKGSGSAALDDGSGRNSSRASESTVPAGGAGGAGSDVKEVTDNSVEEESNECWICRDNSCKEPLIQPCGCRGSMSRVHASCVERWIEHQRRYIVTGDGPPKCSVCRQPYAGKDEKPKIWQLAAHLCCKAIILAALIGCRLAPEQRAPQPAGLIMYGPLRTAMVWLLFQEELLRAVLFLIGVSCFWFIHMPPPLVHEHIGLSWDPPLHARVMVTSLFSVVFVCKLMMTTMSYQDARLRARLQTSCSVPFAHVAEEKLLETHHSDVLNAVFFLGVFCATGLLDPRLWLLPYLSMLIVPVCYAHCEGQFLTLVRIVKPTLLMLAFVFFWPLSVQCLWIGYVWYRCNDVQWQCLPQHLLHPLDAGWHLLVAIGSINLLFVHSNIFILATWGMHSVLLISGLLEQFTVQRLQWRKGPSWWLMLLLAAYTANLAKWGGSHTHCLSRGVGAPYSAEVVRLASFAWLALLAGLAVKTNWSSVVWWYENWQQRHSRFALDIAPRTNPAAVGLLSGEVVPPGSNGARATAILPM